MKRLTTKITTGAFAGTAVCPELYVPGTAMEECDTEVIQAMIDTLAAYEDTNLTPERCAELAQVEKDGRLHIAKVGIRQILYEPNEYGEIYEWEIISVGVGGCVGENYLCERDDGTDVHTFDYGDIGNGVYITREEAESALPEKKGENHG